MAATDNLDAPYGFRPVKHQAAGLIRSNEYGLATDTTLFTGDPVAWSQSGFGVMLATAGARILGVFDGCRFKKSNGEYVYQSYWASGENAGTASDDRRALVYDDPWIVYSIQADDDTTPFPTTGTAIMRNADILYTAGNTRFGQSAVEADASTLTTSVAQLRVLGLQEIPDTNDWGGNEKVLVLINEHAFLTTGNAGIT